MELSSYLKSQREAKGLSVRSLAEKAGISHTEIMRIEDGTRKQPSPLKLRAIADALECSYDAMMIHVGYFEPRSSGMAVSAINGANDLTPEETAEVEKYIEFLKSKRAQ